MADEGPVYGELTFTARSFRDDIERAMGSDLMRALVELVTNADDSYERAGLSGDIVVTVQRRRGAQQFPLLMVRDEAEGMTRAEMDERLGRLGDVTSGFLSGYRVRGLFGRGGRDAVHFGPVSWESWKNGEHSLFEILYEGGPTTRTKMTALRSAGQRKHGTLVTLEIQRKVRIPKQATLKQRLGRHYALRPILLDKRRRKVLVNAGRSSNTERLSYPEPPGTSLVHEQIIAIPGYPSESATVSLSEAPDSLLDGERRQYWRHSLLITSDRAAYDIFDGGEFSREPDSLHLARLFGTVDVPGISTLIRAYDERATQKLDHVEENPVRLVSRDRDGLVDRDEHPFVDALYSAIEEVLRPHIERLRAQADSAAAPHVSDDLRKRLNEAEKVMTEFMREEDDPAEGDTLEGKGEEVGLTLIPSRRVVEPGKPARLLVRYRLPADPASVSPGTLSQTGEPTATVRITEDGASAEPFRETLVDRGGYFSKSIELDPRAEGTTIQVAVRCGTETAHGVAVWEHRDVPPVEELSFNHGKYTIKDGGRRIAYLYAPWDLVANGDVRPLIELAGDPGITYQAGSYGFAFDRTRQAAVSSIVLSGSGIRSRGRLSASLATQQASAQVEVTARGIDGLKIEFDERPDMPYRGWFSQDRAAVLVNTSSPVVERYIGSTAKGLPGQDSVAGRMILAEVLAATVVRDVLARKRQQGSSANDLFYEYETLMAKLLPRLHRAFVPANELRTAQRSSEAVA